MTKFKVPCTNCDGKGTLPPLGNDGDLRDVKRFFPRLCDKCHGAMFIYVDKIIQENQENKSEATTTITTGYSAQGDC